MARDIKTGIRWDRVKALVEAEDWEDDPDGDGQSRQIFIGTVFNLAPSGKYYTPWACSNLDPCPVCGGTRKGRGHRKRRVRARAAKRYLKLLAWGTKHPGNRRTIAQARVRRRALVLAGLDGCGRCDGLGSAEAADDQVFWEKMEAEAEDHGLFVTGGEGDPCDVLVGEYRDRPEEDEEEDDGGLESD